MSLRCLACSVIATPLAVAAGCGGGDTNNTTIVASCGEGTVLDLKTNTCVAATGADAGGGAGGQQGGSGGGATGGGAGSQAGGGAGTSGGGSGGALDAGADATDSGGSDGAVESGSVWKDDKCLNPAPNLYLVNGDPTCGKYSSTGICASGLPQTALTPVVATDLPNPVTHQDCVYVRTPSRPGTNAACSNACSGPGTVASVRIPFGYPRDSTEMGWGICVRRFGEGGDNTPEPWRVTYQMLDTGYCETTPMHGLAWVGTTDVLVNIETDDPNAPARDFQLCHVLQPECK